MRWPWNRKRGHPEPVAAETQASEWGAWVLARMEPGERHKLVWVERPEPPQPITTAYAVRVPRQIKDPLDIAPAFDMRYERVKFGETINLRAIKKNVHTFKLRVKEVFTDPKRVARRHWHKYLVKKRWEQIVSDSNLFYGTR